MHRITMTLIAVLFTIAFLTGCGGKAADTSSQNAEDTAANQMVEKMAEDAIKASLEKEGETNAEVDVQSDGERFSLKVGGADRSFELSAGGDIALPANLPADIPIYEGVKIHMANSEKENASIALQMSVKDPVDKVLAFYKKSAVDQGWGEENTMEMSQDGKALHMLNYSKENRVLNLVIAGEDDGGTSITLSSSSQ